MNIIKTIIVVFSILWAATASAAGPVTGFYVGGAVGTTYFEDDDRARYEFSSNLSDDEDSGGQIFFGYNFNRYIGIEGTFASLGEYSFYDPFYGVTITDSFEAFTVTAVGKLPVGQGPFSFYAKAGFGTISWEEDDPALGTYDDTSGTFTFGIGMMVRPNQGLMAFRIGWDFYSHYVEEDYYPWREYYQSLGMGSVGMQFNF